MSLASAQPAVEDRVADLSPPAAFRALHRSYVERILRAPVYDIAIETPLQLSLIHI